MLASQLDSHAVRPLASDERKKLVGKNKQARHNDAHTTDHAEPVGAVPNPMAGVLGNWGGNATVANEGAPRVNLFL
jgi:hypothetical protein